MIYKSTGSLYDNVNNNIQLVINSIYNKIDPIDLLININTNVSTAKIEN